jgi:hypothetical protein
MLSKVFPPLHPQWNWDEGGGRWRRRRWKLPCPVGVAMQKEDEMKEYPSLQQRLDRQMQMKQT